jgi:hypothetical protein
LSDDAAFSSAASPFRASATTENRQNNVRFMVAGGSHTKPRLSREVLSLTVRRKAAASKPRSLASRELG